MKIQNLQSRGFTMIELLIVVGVLGILATGVLAAVDPFEQLKKARDTNNRQTVISLHTAFTRYFATHGVLPWDNTAINTTAGCGTGEDLFGDTRSTTPTVVPLLPAGAMGDAATPGTTCVGLLETDGELKPGFVAAVGAVASDVYVTSKNSSQLTICFPPTSKSVMAEDNTKYDNAGVIKTAAGEDCDPTNKVVGACYWCAQ